MKGPDANTLRLTGGPAESPLRAPQASPTILRLVTHEHLRSTPQTPITPPLSAVPPPRSPPPSQRRNSRQYKAVQRAVTAENKAAAGLSPDDARAILAARVAESIEGGRAAIVRPAVRRNLVAVGAALGLRPFDTSLVIAIVQDRARAGDAPPHADPRLALIPTPAARAPRYAASRPSPLLIMLAAAALALAMVTALIRWVTRG